MSTGRVTKQHHTSKIDNDGAIVPEVCCPQCGKRVIYNGNYFCEDWGYVHKRSRMGGNCSWALQHPATSAADRAICDALGINYE